MKQETAVRRMIRRGNAPAQIALKLGVTQEQVALEAMNLRNPHPKPGRAAINGTVEAAANLATLRVKPREPLWSVLDRVLVEHATLIALLEGYLRPARV